MTGNSATPARSPLLPDRNPQADLFASAFVDAVPKADMDFD
jgi:hypothetical protein